VFHFIAAFALRCNLLSVAKIFVALKNFMEVTEDGCIDAVLLGLGKFAAFA